MSFNITRNATKHKKLVVGTSTTVPADGDLHVDGNVGVGTSAPPQKLSVVGASSANTNPGIFAIGTDATMGSGTNMLTMGVLDDNYVFIQGTKPGHDTRSLVLQKDGGKVGIGVTPSGAKLDISAGDNTTPQIKLRAVGANTQAEIHASASTGNFTILTGDGDGSQTAKFTIERTSGLATFAGDVTIDKTTPNLKLEADGGGLSWIRMTEGTNHEGGFLLYNGGTNVFSIGVHDGDDTTSGNDFKPIQISRTTRVTTVTNPGWPLKNEISNSGFDVWSNSTLENATGTNLVSAWTNHGSYPYDTFTSSGANITQAVKSTSSGADIASSAITTTEGKLYEISFTCTLASGTLPSVYVASTQTGIAGAVAQRAVAGAQTICFEAASDSDYIMFRMEGAETTDYAISSFTLKEVTPGIETGSAGPDGWARRTGTDLYRQHNDATLTKDGSFYSLKGVGSTTLWQTHWPTVSSDPLHIARFAGKTVTFGAWVYSTLATPEVHLRIDDGGTSDSTQTVAQNTWTWLECTKTISTSAGATFQIAKSGATAETFYVSQVMLVLGSAIGSGNYSRPMGEIVNVEKNITIQAGVSPLAADDKILNLEALSSGKVPKGAKAIRMMSQIKNTDALSDQGIRWGADASNAQPLDVFSTPYVSNVYTQANGVVACDSNGDIYQEVTEAGASLNSLYQYVRAVHLR